MASQAAVDWVEPRLRPDHVRQGHDGVEVAVVELAEGLPAHDVGGVDGQPVVLCAHRARCRSSAAPTPQASPTPRRRRSARRAWVACAGCSPTPAPGRSASAAV